MPHHPEEVIIANCYALRAAVERFADLSVRIVIPDPPLYARTYPGNVDVDTTNPPGSHTVLHLLGGRLENAYTGQYDQPGMGLFGPPGSVGYVPWVIDGWNQGYIIVGIGEDGERILELTNFVETDDTKTRPEDERTIP
jgi:hypothetical protein